MVAAQLVATGSEDEIQRFILIHPIPEASAAFGGSFGGHWISGCSWGLGSDLPVNKTGPTACGLGRLRPPEGQLCFVSSVGKVG